MKVLKIVLSVVAVLVVLVVIIAPIGPMPGVFIGGDPAAPPQQWPDTSKVHEIELKVPGTLPRVVVIWLVNVSNDIHVVGSKSSGWVSMIGNGSPVEMKLRDKTYRLNARPVESGFESILQAYMDKYRPDYPDIVEGFPSLAEAQGNIGVFRLER